MSNAALMFWILVAPVAYAVVDLMKTWSAVKTGRQAGSPAGPWSASLHLKGSERAGQAAAVTPPANRVS